MGMKGLHKVFFAFFLLCCVSGCAQMIPYHYATMSGRDKLVASGHYSDAVKPMEEQLKDLSAAKSEDLIKLCYSYSKLKNYDKLFSCLIHLENNIKKGDTVAYRWELLTGYSTNMAFHGQFPADVALRPTS